MISLENILKISCKRSWRRLEDVLARRLEDVLKRLEDLLKTYSQDEYIGFDQDVLKTSSEDVRLRRTYSSWSRRLEDVFWRRRRKTSSRRLHQDDVWWVITNVFSNIAEEHAPLKKKFLRGNRYLSWLKNFAKLH